MWKTCSVESLRQDWDWQSIFDCDENGNAAGKDYGVSDACHNPHNPLTREPAGRNYTLADVVRVVAAVAGENDGPEWVGVFEMADGRFLIVRAGCDYTGWDCRSGGSSEWTETEAEAISCLTQEERNRLTEG